MANRTKEEIREFIIEHWEDMSDKEMFEQMQKCGLQPSSQIAITRMRQRMGLTREGENLSNCIKRGLKNGSCEKQ